MLTLLMGLASAQSIEMTHQARVLDTSGQPLNGPVALTLSLWETADNGTAMWSTTYDVNADDGFVSVTLGTDDMDRDLQAAWFADDLWLGTAVGGVPLTTRQRFTSVGRSALAHTTEHVLVQGAPGGSSCTDQGAIVFDTEARGLRVCSGGEWIIAGGTPTTNPVFGGANGDGINEADAGASCATIKFDFPSSTSGAYWINPRGDGAYRAWCDMETLGGGWTLVAKIQGNNPFMNRRNTAQWRDRTYVGDPDSLSAVNTLARTYEDVPFTDVLILGVDDSERYMAWRHPSLYPDLFTVVDAGQRISDGVLIGGSVQNLSYPNYPRTDRYNGCRALKYGFFGWDDNQLHAGIAGHTGMLAGHAGGVVAASLFYDGHTVTPPVVQVDNQCISDWAFGGGYSTGTGGDDAYAINAHWWGDGNTNTNTWFTHALLVRHNPGDNDDGQATGALTSPGRSCKQINDLHGPGLPSQTYWLESADGETRYPAYCDMVTEGGGWTLVSKLRGNTPALRRARHSAWRERQYIGDISDIGVEDALGPSYEHVEFTDVMLMGINNPTRRTGWRHPNTYPSVYSIVDAGTRVSDGALLFGNFTTLDYGSNSHINPCSGLKYGFLG